MKSKSMLETVRKKFLGHIVRISGSMPEDHEGLCTGVVETDGGLDIGLETGGWYGMNESLQIKDNKLISTSVFPCTVEILGYEIVVRFPSKKVAEEFASQMSDGFGKGLCDFSHFKQKEGTDGTHAKDYEQVFDAAGRRVYFVSRLFELE
jgi:hypothetical protein